MAGIANAIEADPWELGFIVVTKKIGSYPTDLEVTGREMDIVDDLFPIPPLRDRMYMRVWSSPGLPPAETPFIQEELSAAARKLPVRKTSGLDGILNEILAEDVRWISALLPRAINACLASGFFSSQ